MEIDQYRYSGTGESTLGIWLIDCEFQCYTLEDEQRTIKKYGETRIPEGSYEVKLRAEGGFHDRYKAKFGEEFHKGMLHLQDVPNFEYILIHIGNDDDDTAGCILLGDATNNNTIQDGFISSSTSAYKRIYPLVRDALLNGEQVFINIKQL